MIRRKTLSAISLITAIACFLTVQAASAQQASTTVAGQPGTTSVNPADPAFRAKFSHVDFGGKFAVKAMSDERNSYYIADFSRLQSRFEKIYFLNLVFATDKVVNIDSDITQDRVWFLVSRSYSDEAALAAFSELKAKADKAELLYTPAEKEKWMAEHDKYGKEAAK